MPIYGYQCQDCGHALDALQKVNEELLLTCPKCGKPSLKKQVSAPAFRLKGGGWYETDFKKSNKKTIIDNNMRDADATSVDKPDSKE